MNHIDLLLTGGSAPVKKKNLSSLDLFAILWCFPVYYESEQPCSTFISSYESLRATFLYLSIWYIAL